MAMLNKTVEIISADSDNKLQMKHLIRRILSIYGISAVLFLIKLRAIRSSEQRFIALREQLRSSSAIVLASTIFPVLQKLIGKDRRLGPEISWFATIGTSLLTASNIPTWLPSYVAIESVSEAVYSTRKVRGFIKNLDVSSLFTGRQAILSLIVPFYYARVNEDKNLTSTARFLFSKRSLGRDLVLFYSIWNFLSFYNYFKGLLMEKRRNRNQIPSTSSSRQTDDWPMISGNLKPLMDKLGEIHEITLQDGYSFFEKLMNSSIMKNVIPCFKWALWRQLCVKTLNHTPPKNHNYSVNTCLMKSITLMLGFFVLDGNGNSMNVRPGVLRYLMRCVLNTYITGWNMITRKLILLAASQLAFYNRKRKIL